MRQLIPIPLLTLACAQPADPRPRPVDSEPVVVTEPPSAFSGPRYQLADECTEHIRPVESGGIAGTALVDAHAEIYGGRQPDPFHVHLGWPSSDPSSSIGFVWRTDQETLASMVEITDPSGATVQYRGGSWMFGSQRVHELRICSGLVPGTEYTYRVGGPEHWSKTHSFRTPLPPNTFDSFRVAVLGDSRGSYEEFGEILAMAESHSPDFYVFNGDMVDTGPSQYQWDAWFDAAGDILAEKVLVPAHGNHEYLSVNYFAQFVMPNNEQWFSIRYGDLHLISLNDTVRNGIADIEAQADYLDEVLTNTPSGWQMAAHHQPTWTASTSHAPNLTLRTNWGTLYDKHGVDLAVSGHNHIYERTVPIYQEARADPGEGTVYLVTGGAGAPLYMGFTDQWFSATVQPTEHFAILDFGPNRIYGEVFTPAGDLIDRWAIPR